MAIKAVNDSAGPNGIIPILLIFGSYPRITNKSLPSPLITIRAKAICKVIKELRQLYAKYKVKDTLAIRNRPNTLLIITLPL